MGKISDGTPIDHKSKFHLLLCLVEKKNRKQVFEALVSVLKCTSSHTQSNLAYHILSR